MSDSSLYTAEVPEETVDQIKELLGQAFSLIDAVPDGINTNVYDRMITWALQNFLPASTYFRGVLAYSLEAVDDPDADSQVVIFGADAIVDAIYKGEIIASNVTPDTVIADESD